ncbi:chloride channel protein [Flavihumibacter petaseus]|uniref:Putative ClC family transporter n=1 Tax=Flavihumibacter petaseus NBRC 106054 TaxID=1220578 RepID=A0A0E9MW20_9BACT|nr:chloride channel protein [Flavihumibacter petaseus]GAO41917.1 putative ClC family transporter [Flavihumibacter petaseus NBRC 106054]
MRIRKYYQQVINYLRSRLTRIQLIMFFATLVGFASGIVAVLLKMLVHYLQHWIRQFQPNWFLYLFFPAIGLIATVLLVRYLLGGTFEKGIAMVLKAIARGGSYIPFRHTYVHIVTSSITVGLGGSAGLEAPIVATGSAVGSNISRISEVNYQERTLLIACGAAAGISAVFNAPIAGVIFAVEVLLAETIVSYFIPLIISSVIGVLCSKILLSEATLFNFTLKQTFNYHNVPYYILLGLLCGMVSRYYASAFKRTEHRIHSLKMPGLTRALLSGVLLAVFVFVFPPLFGEGYESVKLIANGDFNSFPDNTGIFSLVTPEWGLILFSLFIVLLKPIAAGVTIGGGGNGGNFAPSLFVGAFLGYTFSRLLNLISWMRIPVGNFSLVGMAGVLSGVMYCPLTAIFLIAEITSGYELFIPLMIVSSTSFFIARIKESHSMETKRLAEEGLIFTHKKERNILTAITLTEILRDDYPILESDKSLKELLEVIKQSEKSIFAIIDKHHRFAGIIELNDIKQRLFQQAHLEKVPLRTVMKKPPATISLNESMHIVMGKFDMTQSWYLPVLDDEGKFMGFVSKTKLFRKYRDILASHEDLYDAS